MNPDRAVVAASPCSDCAVRPGLDGGRWHLPGCRHHVPGLDRSRLGIAPPVTMRAEPTVRAARRQRVARRAGSDGPVGANGYRLAKAEAIRLCGEGVAQATVAARLSVSQASVWRWLNASTAARHRGGPATA